MITVIDYGMGNLRSVQKGLESLGFEAVVTSDPDRVVQGKGVILPGVGAFEDCIKQLRDSGLDKALYEVVHSGKPLLGICLGMQALFSESEENGLHKGLGLIKGRVIKFPPGLKVPHMGWNQVRYEDDLVLFRGIPQESYFYFVHSYYCVPEEQVTRAVCDYTVEFTCAVQKGNILGTQFHPEKSSRLGLQVLKNFGEMLAE